jgi:hypothetical protein
VINAAAHLGGTSSRQEMSVSGWLVRGMEGIIPSKRVWTSFRLASQAQDEQPNHRHLDQRFAGLDLALVVAASPSVARKPTKRALHDPALRVNSESADARGSLHHFQLPIALQLCTSWPTLVPDRPIFFNRGTKNFSPESLRRAPCVSCIPADAVCAP